METKKTITPEMKEKLDAPLPKEAIKQHPSKKFLSTINAIFVTERLNDVFGVGAWRTKTETVTSATTKTGTTMVVTKTIFEIPEYGIYYECYGGNDNADLGDAYKGSMTDAITKIGSYLGIGAHVWKNNPTPTEQHTQQPTQQQPQQIRPNTQAQAQPKPVDMTRRKEKIVAYLNSLDFAELQNTLDYFNIEDVARITDQQVNAVADYLNAHRQQKQ